MNKNVVSIIVPGYNVEKYIITCLESIENQTYQNFEVIIIDDGSTDNTGNICDQFSKKDNRFKVWHTQNGGISKARNIGLEKAKGEYIVFIDSDDYVHKDYIKRLTETIRK